MGWNMTEAELAGVESRLGVLLPSHYRRFLLAYPQALIDAKLDLGHTQESPADRKFTSHPDRLIELNEEVRESGTPWVGEAGDPWPDRYLVIGDDGCGNYYCLDLRAGDEGVWFYDHDAGGFERQFSDLGAFGRWLLEEIEQFDVGEKPPDE